MAPKKRRKRAAVRKKSPKMPSMDLKEMMKDMSPEDMMGMMHEEMPKIMKSCFEKMDAEQRGSMLSMCRSMLDDLEKAA